MFKELDSQQQAYVFQCTPICYYEFTNYWNPLAYSVREGDVRFDFALVVLAIIVELLVGCEHLPNCHGACVLEALVAQ